MEDDNKERTEGLEDGMETGDSWNVPVICNNLERALFLSLHYQFVTPLTSLVVIKPDTVEKGDIAEVNVNITVFCLLSSSFFSSLLVSLSFDLSSSLFSSLSISLFLDLSSSSFSSLLLSLSLDLSS